MSLYEVSRPVNNQIEQTCKGGEGILDMKREKNFLHLIRINILIDKYTSAPSLKNNHWEFNISCCYR